MIPWFAPSFGEEEERRVAAALRSGYINDGPLTREFEREIARRVGRKYGVACTSGTAAIALALMACGVGRYDYVMVPDFTFIATANAVTLSGADPILCDVERETMCLSTGTVEQVRLHASAIVAVEVNGRCPDYAALDGLCEFLITDACESLGAPGLATAGICSCLSFSPAKIITTGQGGMVLTDDEGIYGRLIELKDQGRRHGGTGGNDIHNTLGFNFKFTDLQAAVGLAQLETLGRRIATINRRNAIYSAYLGGDDDPGFRLWFDIVHENRDAIAAALRVAGYDCREFWRPLHTQEPYRNDAEFPNAEYLSRCGLWLPSSFALIDEQIADVVRIVSRHMERVDA